MIVGEILKEMMEKLKIKLAFITHILITPSALTISSYAIGI